MKVLKGSIVLTVFSQVQFSEVKFMDPSSTTAINRPLRRSVLRGTFGNPIHHF
jgi:hypothetical protein